MEKKNVLLVGASGGIGKAILENLYKNYNIIAVGRSESVLNQLKSDFPEIDIKIFDHLSNKEEEFMQSINCKLDAVVIASGITSDGLAIRLSDDLWDKTLAVNLTSVFKLVKHSYRKLNQDSSIVVLSSVVARFGNIGQVAYAASKGGLEAMVRTLGKEFAKKATVNAIAPGFIETEMTKNLDLQNMLSAIPAGRIGKASEVAACVEFLLSDGARYITGHTLEVNGGMYMS